MCGRSGRPARTRLVRYGGLDYRVVPRCRCCAATWPLGDAAQGRAQHLQRRHDAVLAAHGHRFPVGLTPHGGYYVSLLDESRRWKMGEGEWPALDLLAGCYEDALDEAQRELTVRLREAEVTGPDDLGLTRSLEEDENHWREFGARIGVERDTLLFDAMLQRFADAEWFAEERAAVTGSPRCGPTTSAPDKIWGCFGIERAPNYKLFGGYVAYGPDALSDQRSAPPLRPRWPCSEAKI